MSSVDLSSYQVFFQWCRSHGLQTDRQIATAFARTPQTIRNWKRGQTGEQSVLPPLHLSLACKGYEFAHAHGTHRNDSSQEPSMSWFQNWRHHHGLDTLEATGDAFGLTRQAVHNWHKRGRLPRWLPMACLGYEESNALKDVSGV